MRIRGIGLSGCWQGKGRYISMRDWWGEGIRELDDGVFGWESLRCEYHHDSCFSGMCGDTHSAAFLQSCE